MARRKSFWSSLKVLLCSSYFLVTRRRTTRCLMNKMQNNSSQISCQLFFIVARQANVALILRRGPSKWVQLIKWNIDQDSFETGQWFHGRVYESKCDVSPDGKRFVYFARKERRNAQHTTWTAVSNIPYFTAVAFIPNGNHSYGGGGMFKSNSSVAVNINDLYPEVSGLSIKNLNLSVSYESILMERLKIYGWDPISYLSERGLTKGKINTVKFNKDLTRSDCQLELDLDPDDFKNKSFHIIKNGIAHDLRCDWADVDHSGRLLLSRQGRLFWADIRDHIDFNLIADFTDNRPQEVKTPEWAKRW